jgi:hypothetical protein
VGEAGELDPAARALRALNLRFQDALPPVGETTTVGAVLARRVELVWEGCRAGDDAAGAFVRGAGGRIAGALARGGLSPALVREAVARQHGYADWAAALAEHDRPVDPRFEAAVEAVVCGEVDTLRALLDTDPALVGARAPFGHRASLVHYVAANGVEMTRQWHSPGNAPRILRALLERGAEPDALCQTYRADRAQTPMCLLVSSSHPAEAGVQAELVAELCRGGANPDGLDADGLPLWTAITFGYSAAAEALARCGARVDNLVFAAALGELERVETYFDPNGRPRPGSAPGCGCVGAGGAALDPDRVIDYALIYAAGHGRGAIVEFLLGKHPDLTVTDPVFGSTALGAARYHHRTDITALLQS